LGVGRGLKERRAWDIDWTSLKIAFSGVSHFPSLVYWGGIWLPGVFFKPP